MPFNSTAHAITLTTLGVGWELLGDETEIVDSGWDTTSAKYATRRGTVTSSADLVKEWPSGRALPGLEGFYAGGTTVRAFGGGIWVATVNGKGLVANRPARRRGGASAIRQSVENVKILGAFYPKAEIWESAPTLEIDTIWRGQPPTHWVGGNQIPPNAPPVRGSGWTGLTDPTFHFPNGWVVADVRYEQFGEIDLYLVTIVYEYRYAFTP